MSEVAGVKREASSDEWSGGAKRSRGEGNLTLRFLLASKHAGGIIGKGGETIKRLRSEYSAQVYVPDNPGNERVLSIGAERDNSIGVWKDCLPLMHEPPYPVGQWNGVEKDPNNFEVNFLVHSSQVGGVIGKQGARIKQIREETSAGVKVYPDCLPGCNERVVAMSGTEEQIVNALEQVLDTMVEQPIKGDVILYDPSIGDDGGYGNDGGFGGGYNNGANDGGGMAGSMQGGGNYGGPQGGYNQNNFGGGNNYNQGGQGGYGGNNNNQGGGGGNFGGNFGGAAGGGGGNQGPNQGGGPGHNSTQVTIPNDMAGAIIGQGGKRIQEIRLKCGAQIKFADPEPGKKDRLITISGSDEQIQYAQYLMQQCVLNNSSTT